MLFCNDPFKLLEIEIGENSSPGIFTIIAAGGGTVKAQWRALLYDVTLHLAKGRCRDKRVGKTVLSRCLRDGRFKRETEIFHPRDYTDVILYFQRHVLHFIRIGSWNFNWRWCDLFFSPSCTTCHIRGVKKSHLFDKMHNWLVQDKMSVNRISFFMSLVICAFEIQAVCFKMRLYTSKCTIYTVPHYYSKLLWLC